MSVLGPGAICCQKSDCDIECDFDKTAPAETPEVETPVVVPTPPTGLQVQEPEETVKVDATDKPQSDDSPGA